MENQNFENNPQIQNNPQPGQAQNKKKSHIKIFGGVVGALLLVAVLSNISLPKFSSDNTNSSSQSTPVVSQDLGNIKSAGDYYNVSSDEQLPSALLNKNNGGDLHFKVVDPEKAKNNPIIVWDWGSVDGDVIQINSQPIALTHEKKPIPVTTERNIDIEVLGLKDGVGGITVGVFAPGCSPEINIMNLQPGQTHRISVR